MLILEEILRKYDKELVGWHHRQKLSSRLGFSLKNYAGDWSTELEAGQVEMFRTGPAGSQGVEDNYIVKLYETHDVQAVLIISGGLCCGVVEFP